MELEPRIRELYQRLFEEKADVRYLAKLSGLITQERKCNHGDEQNDRRK